MKSAIKTIQERLEKVLFGNDDEYKRLDSIQSSDPDFMKYNPNVMGYDSTAEQQYIYQNNTLGFDASLFSILDIGCGRGDLYGHLQQITDNNIFSYAGVDHNPIMQIIAKEKYNIDITCSSFEKFTSTPYDWVVAIGYFLQRRTDSTDTELIKVFDDIDKMYNLCNTAVSFNLLSPINIETQPEFFYMHPGLIMDMLIEKYQYVNIRHNYSNSMYTITIFKK
jgi:SAM-dependent methyltransferase